MALGETIFFWSAVGFYILGFIVYLSALIFEHDKYFTWVLSLSGMGLVFNTAALITRYITVNHLPVQNTYELDLLGAWAAVGLYLILSRRYPAIKLAGLAVLPFSFLLLGYGILTSPQGGPLGPAYKSSWLVVHVSFAFLSYGCFAISTGVAAVYLLKNRYSEEKMPDFYKNFPPLEVLDQLAFRLIAFGFIANTVMLLSGSLWAQDLWGSYWSWDPIETWALIGWLVYGLFLHLKLTWRWPGQNLAWLNLLSFLVIILSFWGVPYLTPSLHDLNDLNDLNNLTMPLPK